MVENILVKHYNITQSEKNYHFINFYHTNLEHFIQTLKRLDIGANKITDEGIRYLSEALKSNTVRNKQSLFFIFIIFVWIISCRHSQSSISIILKSKSMVPDILVKHYKRTQWDINNQFLHFNYVDLEHFIQTLIELSLRANRIRDEGIKCIGEALQTNKVREKQPFS